MDTGFFKKLLNSQFSNYSTLSLVRYISYMITSFFADENDTIILFFFPRSGRKVQTMKETSYICSERELAEEEKGEKEKEEENPLERMRIRNKRTFLENRCNP